jgi:hypothetical protein
MTPKEDREIPNPYAGGADAAGALIATSGSEISDRFMREMANHLPLHKPHTAPLSA